MYNDKSRYYHSTLDFFKRRQEAQIDTKTLLKQLLINRFCSTFNIFYIQTINAINYGPLSRFFFIFLPL